MVDSASYKLWLGRGLAMRLCFLLVFIYGMMGVCSFVVAYWLRQSPLLIGSPWIILGPSYTMHMLSLSLGLVIGLAGVALTRWAVSRFLWARALHLELRPFALSVGAPRIRIWSLAIFSSLGEELLFRGLLQPWLGLGPQALLFGVLHQTRGSSRWVYSVWAGIIGLVLGGLFQCSGSLLGCILAHAIINLLNLDFLRVYDPAMEPVHSRGNLGA